MDQSFQITEYQPWVNTELYAKKTEQTANFMRQEHNIE